MKRQPSPEPPVTYTADAEAMRDELDYEDMIALSGMFRRWAIYEAEFRPEQRCPFRKLYPAVAMVKSA